MRLLLIFALFLTILPGCLTTDQDEPVEVLGETTVALKADKTTVRTGEALIGNFLTDVMTYYANKVNWTINKESIQFAILNGGTIRITEDKYTDDAYPAGDLTNYMIDEMLPFEDTTVLAEVTGTQLKQIFEHAVSMLPDGEGHYLQVSSGIKVTYDISRQQQIISTTGTPEIITPGERITSIQIKNGETFEEYTPEGKYRLITNRYIGTGGDGYVVFQNLPDARLIDVTIFDMILEYLKEFSPITPKIEGRLIQKGSALGKVTVDLKGDDTTLGTGEALMGDLVADSMFAAAKAKDSEVVGAMVNAGNLSGSGNTIPMNTPFIEDTINDILEYDNELVVVTLTGAQLKEVLEHSVSNLPEYAPFFMQLSDQFTVWVNTTKQAEVLTDGAITTPGERIISVAFDGPPIDLTDTVKTYKIVVSNFIANGFNDANDGYTTLMNLDAGLKTNLGITDRQALTDYIRNNTPLTPELGNRINFNNEK